MAPSRKQILIVEDEEVLARLLRWHLETADFDVTTVGTGRAALHDAAEHQPDLVVLDLRLPDLHGYDVARELRQLFHPWVVPILILTGLDQPIDRLRDFAHGADAYLTKPYEPTEVLQTMPLLVGAPTETSRQRRRHTMAKTAVAPPLLCYNSVWLPGLSDRPRLSVSHNDRGAANGAEGVYGVVHRALRGGQEHTLRPAGSGAASAGTEGRNPRWG